MRVNLSLFLFVCWFFGIVFLSSCVKEPDYCKDFNRLSIIERKEAVRKNSIETNFALIRCSYYTEGGPVIADEPIIEAGQSSVPFLLSKLEESKDEDEQERAISLLLDIDINKNLQNRAEIISKIEQTVNRMKNESKKQYSLEMLNKMKGEKVP